MKKKNLVPFVGLVALLLLSFINNNESEKYPNSLPNEYVEVFKGDFIKTMTDDVLLHTIHAHFSPLFDTVKSIDAQFNAEYGYYYLVFGVKDTVEKVEILKINESDIENSTYTYIDFSKIDANAVVEYCRYGPDASLYPFVCTGPCAPRDNNCLGGICGVRVGNQCLQE